MLSELKSVEKKVPILGTQVDILINNVLSGKNDHLEPSGKLDPKVIISVFLVRSLEIILTPGK